jgi:hypothetical protein
MVKDLQFYKISFPTEQILASQKGLSSIKLLEVQIVDLNTRITQMHSYTFSTHTDAHGLKTVDCNLTFIKLTLYNTKYILCRTF